MVFAGLSGWITGVVEAFFWKGMDAAEIEIGGGSGGVRGGKREEIGDGKCEDDALPQLQAFDRAVLIEL